MKKALPWIITIANILLAVGFCIAFFVILKDLPDTIPVHWSGATGVDRWGAKSELYPMAIIPTVLAGLAFPISTALLLKKKPNGFVYLINGISMFTTVIMIVAGSLMLNLAR